MMVMKKLWERLGNKETIEDVKIDKEHPMMVGMIERVLYTTSWILGQPIFIAVWIALKVAGGWKGWNEMQIKNGLKVRGRSIFNVFLIGNAFSIAYAIAGSLFITLSKTFISVDAIVIVSALIVGTFAFWLWNVILLCKQSNNPA